MTASITWSVSALDRNMDDGKVTQIHYRVTGVDGEFTSGTYGSAGVNDEISVPYDQITEYIAIQWAKTALGPEEVAGTEAGVANALQEQANPTTGTGLPWGTFDS